jgi:hypothetical protein
MKYFAIEVTDGIDTDQLVTIVKTEFWPADVKQVVIDNVDFKDVEKLSLWRS